MFLLNFQHVKVENLTWKPIKILKSCKINLGLKFVFVDCFHLYQTIFNV